MARELGNAVGALMADKLEAQIKGLLNKQGEPAVVIYNNTLNLSSYSTDQLLKVKEILNE